jgi:FMN phosphatase YigB (HAD superfamily)
MDVAVTITSLDRSTLDALLFDVDGTLYDQRALRVVMAWELVKAACVRPRQTRREVAVLRAYRRAQEELREETIDDAVARDLATEQLRRAAQRSGVARADHGAIVRAWMEIRPLTFLAKRTRAGLVSFLDRARAKQMKLGVVSDYPAGAKLRALGIASYFDVVVCAQDDDVGRFKPHPRGLLAAAAALGVAPARVLYIGDRVDVDAAAATAAGMQCAIVGRREPGASAACIFARDFNALGRSVFS